MPPCRPFATQKIAELTQLTLKSLSPERVKSLSSFILVFLIGAAGCVSSPIYHVPSEGHFFNVRQKDGKNLFTVVDSHSVDSYQQVFLSAAPLREERPSDSKADFVFTEILDGKVIKEYVLYRDGEMLSAGQWFRVDAAWHYRWRIMYDPKRAAEDMKKDEPATKAQLP